jgi:nicotinate dehydrogenase subunit A
VISFRVNGGLVESDAQPATPLIYILRNDLRLTGTRFGCGLGTCGACVVLIDGQPTPSCDTPLWAVESRDVVTVEGLGEGAPHPVQEALLAEQAGQCGYCLSGMIVSAAALLERDPQPDEQAVRDSLDRHLCRCGVHNRVVRAVLRVAAAAGETGRGC